MFSNTLSSDKDPAIMVKKLCINAIEPIELKKFPIDRREVSKTGKQVNYERGKPFSYERLIEHINTKAREHGRNFTDDICFMISTFYVHGNKIDDLLGSSSPLNETAREKLTKLQSIYNIRNRCFESNKFCFSLNKVTEAFPHVSLVLADMLNSVPDTSRLRFCVSSDDLAAEVHHHFKLGYFPNLIEVADWKAQIALLVYNLCNAKCILNTRGVDKIEAAFELSCKISASLLTRNTRLAPEDARQKFTKHIVESFSFNAELLSLVWDRVIGETRIPISGRTMITSFHEQVLNQQPLDLSKWRQLLDDNGLDSV